MSMKNSSDIIGNRTRDLLIFSAVPQPNTSPRAPGGSRLLRKIFRPMGGSKEVQRKEQEETRNPYRIFCFVTSSEFEKGWEGDIEGDVRRRECKVVTF